MSFVHKIPEDMNSYLDSLAVYGCVIVPCKLGDHHARSIGGAIMGYTEYLGSCGVVILYLSALFPFWLLFVVHLVSGHPAELQCTNYPGSVIDLLEDLQFGPSPPLFF